MKIDTVLFDLDKTLSDHYFSAQNALEAVQSEFSETLARFDIEELMKVYDQALENAYDDFLEKKLTLEEGVQLKIRLFYEYLKLDEPQVPHITKFTDIYREAYADKLRPTEGSIDVLRTLRQTKYKIAIVTNGGKEEQRIKADRIGVLDLVDTIVTSDEVQCAKPDVEIFQQALSRLNSSANQAVMIGDSLSKDIKGAIGADIIPLLYDPTHRDEFVEVDGVKVGVLRRMEEVLEKIM